MKIFLSTTLRKYVPDYDPAKGLETDISKGTTVADLCRQSNIPINEVKIIMVDGTKREKEHVLSGGERVYLFPPVGGG